MALNLNRLKEIAKHASEKERAEARFREENRDWLLKSALIALEVHRYLRLNRMSQSQLAEKLEISSAMVSKLLSGKENLSLKTICRIEDVLQIELVNIPSYENSAFLQVELQNMMDKGLEFDRRQTTSYCKVLKMNTNTTSKKKEIA